MGAGCVVTGEHDGHRYTLTEGDFHHLKNARLTHLHLPPLKIVTIHECDSGEASTATMPHPTATPKASLAIFQVSVEGLAARSRLGKRNTLTLTQQVAPFCSLGSGPSSQDREGGQLGCTEGGWAQHTPTQPPMLFDLSLLPPPRRLCPTAPGEGPHWPLCGPQLRPAR